MKIVFLITAVVICSMACQKVESIEGDLPACIQEKIQQIQDEPVRNPPAKVYRYEYNGQTVYYIPPHCCDIPSELYNEACEPICSPDGGMTGHGDGRCTDFYDTRTNGQVIWEDSRN